MSKVYAFVKPETGEITYTASVKGSEGYTDGSVMGDYVMYDITEFGPPSTFMTTKYYDNGEWLDKPVKPNEYYNWTPSGWVFDSDRLFSKIRSDRNSLLTQSDWTQLPDAPLTDTQKAEWATYRQALRDVPINNSNVTSLEEVVWPTQPAS